MADEIYVPIHLDINFKNKKASFLAGFFIADIQRKMVGTAGFEPTTPTPPVWCATWLRYAPTINFARFACAVLCVSTARDRHNTLNDLDCKKLLGSIVAELMSLPNRP